ncbi:MAG: DUF1801 domain-containing protein [Polyangiaceae bacterium]
MAETKTRPTTQSVSAFIASIEDEQQRKDAKKLLALMKKATGKPARMWGTSIVGFGSYHYVYDSGHEGDACLTGFSPRKSALTLYVTPGFTEYGPLLGKLGKVKTGKACLYIKKLDDVDLRTLETLVSRSVRWMEKRAAERARAARA